MYAQLGARVGFLGIDARTEVHMHTRPGFRDWF